MSDMAYVSFYDKLGEKSLLDLDDYNHYGTLQGESNLYAMDLFLDYEGKTYYLSRTVPPEQADKEELPWYVAFPSEKSHL